MKNKRSKWFGRAWFVLTAMVAAGLLGMPLSLRGEQAQSSSEPLFSFVVLGDPHLAENRPGFPPGLDYFRALAAALKTRPRKPDFVIITGDLVLGKNTDTNAPAYARLKELAEAFPVHITFGNNDQKEARELIRKLCPDDFKEQDFYAFDHKNCRFVVICDAIPSDHVGHFCSQQIRGSLLNKGVSQWSWLEEKLKPDGAGRRVFVFGHIPPFYEGSEEKASISPGDAPLLRDLVAKYKPAALFFGHLHRKQCFSLAGSPVYVARSTHWNFDEPPGFIEVGVYPGTNVVDYVDLPELGKDKAP